MDRRDDARSKKIIFVSSCLLNTNNKVKGLARYPGMCKEVFDTLNKYGLGINQMDCPETLYLGISRWFHTKNLPGSHVILKTNGSEIPDRTFEEAAQLAAHYSKAEGASKVEVDYVQR